ncbi:MAG: polyisoprenyl-teichoic acid--peptidoglycan teichoic acid transferase [Patescibacteria group bacterium]|nr:polyisoprenyl-teichoic acid--peptidoglycan teichoic acid transferase [Patescibacteria group bacterium]
MFKLGPVLKYFFLLIFIVSIIASILFFKNGGLAAALFKPVSVVSKVFTAQDIKSTDGRTNILVLGLDQRSPGSTQGGVLTDTIMVVSIGDNNSNTVMVSIPRDLWVDEIDEKINALYAWNYFPYEGRGRDVKKVQEKVEEILGIPIHYTALVGFSAFKDAITAVDGLDIEVDEAFVDHLYPVEGMENAIPESSRYMTVRFEKGMQTMDGEKALQYARSRHSENFNEAGDFARARRQQKVLVALKDEILSSETLLNPSKISELYEAYKQNVETDISLSEILYFYDMVGSTKNLNVKKIVLSNELKNPNILGSGMLESPTEEEREQFYSGKYVLVPTGRTFEAIKTLVRSYLFCDDSQAECK